MDGQPHQLIFSKKEWWQIVVRHVRHFDPEFSGQRIVIMFRAQQNWWIVAQTEPMGHAPCETVFPSVEPDIRLKLVSFEPLNPRLPASFQFKSRLLFERDMVEDTALSITWYNTNAFASRSFLPGPVVRKHRWYRSHVWPLISLGNDILPLDVVTCLWAVQSPHVRLPPKGHTFLSQEGQWCSPCVRRRDGREHDVMSTSAVMRYEGHILLSIWFCFRVISFRSSVTSRCIVCTSLRSSDWCDLGVHFTRSS